MKKYIIMIVLMLLVFSVNAGEHGSSLEFDGVDQYVNVLSPTGLPSGDVAKSIEVQVIADDLCNSANCNIGGFGTNVTSQNF